jgi:hypothetical protein
MEKARFPCFSSCSANLSILHYYQHKDRLNSALNHCQEKDGVTSSAPWLLALPGVNIMAELLVY